MSKKNNLVPLFLLVLLLVGACKAKKPGNTYVAGNETAELIKNYPDRDLVLIKTDKGDMIVALFNETPLHRDNFLKLAGNHFYDSLLFHRVIKNFMIQGGDPDSKKANPTQKLGDGDIGYTVPAEFNPKIFHKKGMLAAAREGEDINPTKASSACQFYLVQGKVFDEQSLKKVEYRVNRELRLKLKADLLEVETNKPLKEKEEHYKKEGLKDSLKFVQDKIDSLINIYYEKTPHTIFSEEQKKTYMNVGGTPHLDGSYTVFGEIVSGLNILDLIAAEPTDENDRPINNVRMSMIILKQYTHSK